MNPDLNPLHQMRRTRVLNDLARLDGRRDPTHPLYGRFTGLAQPMTRICQLESEMADLRRQIGGLCDRLAAASEALAGLPPAKDD
jgi:hypothetical protein